MALFKLISFKSLQNPLRLCNVPTRHQSQEKKNTTPKQKYDIIIAGGGMVGCTLACVIAKDPILSNLKVLLLEGNPNTEFKLSEKYSNRVVSINNNTKSLFKAIDVWKHIEAMRCATVKQMQVWDACSDVLIHFNNETKLEVANIVENSVLLHAVHKELTNKKNLNRINIMYGAKISGYELATDSGDTAESKVIMENGEVYACKVLIGADGIKSKVREAMGVQYLSWDYDQLGVVATLKLAESDENTTAWQRFLPTGPIALLPLNNEYSSLVWSTNVDEAKSLLKLPEDQFVDALNDALWRQYPKNDLIDKTVSTVSKVLDSLGLETGTKHQFPPSVSEIIAGSRAAFPLGFGHSTKYVGKGVALIGDAAHRVHPLAGQGVNLGFGDVKELAKLMSNTIYRGQLLTESSWLLEYESKRQCHNIPTQMAIEALHRLYTVDFTPVVLARSIGLQITNALRPVKRAIMEHATS